MVSSFCADNFLDLTLDLFNCTYHLVLLLDPMTRFLATWPNTKFDSKQQLDTKYLELNPKMIKKKKKIAS